MAKKAGTELATAYISLLPSMRGFVPNFKKVLGEASAAASSSGKGMGGVMFGALAGVGMSVMNKAMSTIRSSISGAVSRVDTLNAFPKVMANLGYSSKDASASIKKMSDELVGLPTTLDQMAGTVQVMAPLTGSLDEATNISLALNNALIAGGKSAQEQSNAMQQYSQMLAVGSVDMAAWRSMVSAMPGQMDQMAKSLLGASAGQQDLYDAMKEGSVTFDDFNNELQKLNTDGLEVSGKKFGSFAEQAKAATGGIGTSFAVMHTAVTRGMANIIQPFAPLITTVLQTVTQGINAIGGLFAGGAEKIAEFLTGMFDGSNQAGSAFGELVSKASEIIPMLASITSNFNPLSLIMQAIQPLLPQVGEAFMAIGEALLDVLPPFVAVSTMIGSAVIPVLTSLISSLLPPLLGLIKQVAPIIATVAKAFTPLVSVLLSVVTPILHNLGQLISTVFNAIVPIVSGALTLVSGIIQTIVGLISGNWSMAWDGIKSVFVGVWEVLKSTVQAVFTTIGAFISAALSNISAVWNAGWALIFKVVSTIWNGIKNGISNAVKSVFNSIQGVLNTIRNTWTNVWNSVKSFVTSVWNGIKTAVSNAINNVRNTVSNIVNAIRSVWQSVWNSISSFFSNVWSNIVSAAVNFGNSVREKFNAVTDFIRNIPGKILGFFGNIGSTLIDSGRSLIQGFLDGIAGAFNKAKDFVADGLAGLRDLFPFSPAKEGPFSGKGWVLYSGLSIGETFAGAIADSLHNGRKQVVSELDGISNEFDNLQSPDFSYTIGRNGMFDPYHANIASTSRNGVVQNNNIQMVEKDPQLIMRQLNRELGAVL